MTSIPAQQKILGTYPPNVALFLEKMREMGKERDIPNISWDTALFMRETLQSRNISEILEIGPANGFSTMMLALACPNSQITSIEFSRHAFEELRCNIDTFSGLFLDEESAGEPADFGPKVTSSLFQQKIGQFSLYYADARELLPAFLEGKSEFQTTHPRSMLVNIPQKRFDCIFIDGAFRMTREFFDLSRPLLAENGLILLDDAIKFRWKMNGFHEYLEVQGVPYQLVQTDQDDGVMVIDFGNISKGDS